MPWLRVGDTAANHPTVLAVLEHQDIDDRLVNEVFGFVVRCAAQSTAHLTDYIVNRGTALAIAGISRSTHLIKVAQYAGYITVEERDLDDGQGPRTVYKLVDDPEFIHMRTKEEIEWERQRKSDNSDPALIIPVRMRDGDACRYCGLVVNWRARKGRIRGTYDHRVPGQRGTIDTTVVACEACNASRGNDPKADERLPLLPEPRKPYFSPFTIEWLEEHEWAQRNGYKAPKPPAHPIQPGQHSGNGTTGRKNTSTTTSGSNGSTTGSNGNHGNGATPGPSNQGDGTTGPQQGNGASSGPHNGAEVPITSDNGAPAETPTAPVDPGNGNEAPPIGIASGRFQQIPADPSERLSTTSGNPGTGRDGSGRAGTGRPGAAAPAQPRSQGGKNSRRRSRPRKRR